MENQEFIKQFRGLLAANNPLTEIDNLLQKTINSGAVYIAGEQEESYRLCKIVYYAILCEMCDHWKPLDMQHIKEAKEPAIISLTKSTAMTITALEGKVITPSRGLLSFPNQRKKQRNTGNPV